MLLRKSTRSIKLFAVSLLIYLVYYTTGNTKLTHETDSSELKQPLTTPPQHLENQDKIQPATEYIKSTEDSQISPWSYQYTDDKCDKNQVIGQFYGFTHKNQDYWKSLTPQNITQMQLQLEEYLSEIKDMRDFEGRGIIFTAWPDALRMISISINFIRSFGCNLVIELWHNDELSPEDVQKMESLPNVYCKNIKLIGGEDFLAFTGEKLYAAKGAALLLTELDEVLLIDADNIPARDPTFLFESDPFVETGALFWKDYWMTRPDNPIFDILGLECTNENEQESGEMVLKRTSPGVYKALSLAFYMQQDTTEFKYQKLLHGDKDTFRYAWRHLGLDYHMVRPYPGIAGDRGNSGRVCGNTIIQFSPKWLGSEYGEPPKGHVEEDLEVLFYHLNGIKDIPVPNLDWLSFYKDGKSHGFGGFFKDQIYCVMIQSEMKRLGFFQEITEAKIDQDFVNQYIIYFNDWEE